MKENQALKEEKYKKEKPIVENERPSEKVTSNFVTKDDLKSMIQDLLAEKGTVAGTPQQQPQVAITVDTTSIKASPEQQVKA